MYNINNLYSYIIPLSKSMKLKENETFASIAFCIKKLIR